MSRGRIPLRRRFPPTPFCFAAPFCFFRFFCFLVFLLSCFLAFLLSCFLVSLFPCFLVSLYLCPLVHFSAAALSSARLSSSLFPSASLRFPLFWLSALASRCLPFLLISPFGSRIPDARRSLGLRFDPGLRGGASEAMGRRGGGGLRRVSRRGEKPNQKGWAGLKPQSGPWGGEKQEKAQAATRRLGPPRRSGARPKKTEISASASATRRAFGFVHEIVDGLAHFPQRVDRQNHPAQAADRVDEGDDLKRKANGGRQKQVGVDFRGVAQPKHIDDIVVVLGSTPKRDEHAVKIDHRNDAPQDGRRGRGVDARIALDRLP